MSDMTNLSPFHLRQLADNLTRYSDESAFRQIDAHVVAGDISESDAAQLRRMVTGTHSTYVRP